MAEKAQLEQGLKEIRAGRIPTISDEDRPALFLHAMNAMKIHVGPLCQPPTSAFKKVLMLRDRCAFPQSGEVEPWWIAAWLLSPRAAETIVFDPGCPNPHAIASALSCKAIDGSMLAAIDAPLKLLTTCRSADFTQQPNQEAAGVPRIIILDHTGDPPGNIDPQVSIRLPNNRRLRIFDSSITHTLDLKIDSYHPAMIAELASVPRRLGELQTSSSTAPAEKIEPLSFSRRDPPRESISPVYDAYEPRRAHCQDSKPHPSELIESKSQASIQPPPITVDVKIPKNLIEKGVLSSAQMEAIALAHNAHAKKTSENTRFGFYLADGTGVGKTNEQIGLYLANFNENRRRAIYVTEKSRHLANIEKTMMMLNIPRSYLIDVSAYKTDEPIPNRDGILFITYSRLREKNNESETRFLRLEQIAEWFGHDADGLIVFDECHNMRNAIGNPDTPIYAQPPSAQGEAGVALQKKLPNARILYASATGLSDLYNLAYMPRLGLWGKNTPFGTVDSFLSDLKNSGLSGLEMIATHLSASGLMISRTLSMKGIRAETLMHYLSINERKNWDDFASLMMTLRAAIPEAWKNATERIFYKNPSHNGWAPQEAIAHFETAARRIAEMFLISNNTPTMIADIHEALDRGEAPVIQIMNTYETAGDNEGNYFYNTIERLIDQILPIHVLTKQKSVKRSQLKSYTPAKHSNNGPLLIQANVSMRTTILDLARKINSPRPPLDQIFEAFGADKIAEVTGRNQRLVFNPQTGVESIETRNENTVRADLSAFMADRKKILIFSVGAGGSSMDYHAALDCKNQRQRRHYILQSGQRADHAIQGVGRTHRSNQASAPILVLVSSDLPAERAYRSRTLSRIRRLGATTQGHRDASSGSFNMQDSYENQYARAAFIAFLSKMTSGQYHDINVLDFESTTNLTLMNDKKTAYTADETTFRRILSRLSRCDTTFQEKVFSRIDSEIEFALAKTVSDRTFDIGPEHITEKVEILEHTTLLTDGSTGAKVEAWTVSGIKSRQLKDLDEALAEADTYDILGLPIRWAWRPETGRPFIQVPASENDRGYVNTYRIIEPDQTHIADGLDQEIFKAQTIPKNNIKTMKDLWNARCDAIQELATRPAVILSGALPLIYHSIAGENGLQRPVIADTSTGRRIMGVMVTPENAKTITMTARTIMAHNEVGKNTDNDIDRITTALANQHTAVFTNDWMINIQIAYGASEAELHVHGADRQALAKTAPNMAIRMAKTGNNIRFLLPSSTTGRARALKAILAQTKLARIEMTPDWNLIRA